MFNITITAATFTGEATDFVFTVPSTNLVTYNLLNITKRLPNAPAHISGEIQVIVDEQKAVEVITYCSSKVVSLCAFTCSERAIDDSYKILPPIEEGKTQKIPFNAVYSKINKQLRILFYIDQS